MLSLIKGCSNKLKTFVLLKFVYFHDHDLTSQHKLSNRYKVEKVFKMMIIGKIVA
jgi:hypothetical protein